jgi:hypothetical protein
MNDIFEVMKHCADDGGCCSATCGAGVSISYSSIVCNFGITLDDRLTFDDHINDVCSRVHYSL